MFGADPRKAVQFRRQGGHGVAQRERQKVLRAPAPRAGVERLPFQPDAHYPASVDGQGAESGEALVEVGVAHGGGVYSGLLEGRGWEDCRDV
ncbi:hypothetical protein D3C85_1253660 [compost metagenome]